MLFAVAFASNASAKAFKLADGGRDPHLAVGDSGVGHIVWNEQVQGDDILHYCRLPRGAKSCSPERTFNLAGEDFEGPRVLYNDGLLTLVTSRCCFPGDHLTILQSGDGGATFTAPRYIARPTTLSNFSPMGGGGNVAAGPGAFQLSTASSGSGGTYFQAAPTAGPPTAVAAHVDDDVPGPTADTTSPSVAFADPLSPVVAFEQITSGKTFIRSYDGSGDYNSTLNWRPTQFAGAGDEPRLAGGLGGLYLLYRVGKPGKQRYVSRRITPAGPGSKVEVSARGTPIFRAFSEDAGGTLHAAWVDNGKPDKLRYSRSANGKAFSEPKTLASGRDNLFNTDVGAGEDGGGWGLWTTDSGTGAIKAAPFPPLKGGGGSQPCVPKVSYGKAVLIAREGCLQKSGNAYSTADAARLNGLDLDPHGSATPAAGSSSRGDGFTRASGPSKLVLDTAKGTLKSSGAVRTKAGNVQLDDGPLAWKLPKGGGTIKDLAGNPAIFNTGKLKVDFLGLPVLGKTSPEIGGGQGMTVPVHLKLPEPFGSLLGGAVTGDSELRLDNPSGLKLDNVSVRADSVFLGIAEVKDLKIDYVSDPFVLDGSARILLPVAKSSLSSDFGLRDGGFDYAKATLNFDAPGRPISQFTYLRSVGFQILTDPLKLAGLASVTAGPTVPGLNVAAARVNGLISYTFPKAPAAGVFRAEGKGFIANVPTSNVFAQYETTGKLSLGGNFALGIGGGPSISGTVDGLVDIPSGGFDLAGSGQGCGIPAIGVGCIGVKVLLSKKAVAGCGTASIGPPFAKVSVSAGLAHYWSGGGFDFFGGCDLKPYKSVTSAQTRRSSDTITMPKGLPQASIKIEGEGAAPRVILTSPSGRELNSPAPPGQSAQNELGAIGPSAYAKATFASLPKPEPGRWKIEALSGSAPIAGVSVADGLPEVKIRARVGKGHGRRRVLVYRAKAIDGQRIRFFEVGKGVSKRLGATRGGREKIRFSAADGPGGRRHIVAAVDSFGLPRDRINVAAYRAPAPIKPGKPRHLRLRRRGGKLIASWRHAKGAERYVASIKLKDGRRLVRTTTKTTVKVRSVPGIDSAKVQVAGLRADNRLGKVARARLKARPKKRHRGR